MNIQEIYNKVCDHLLTQKVRCVQDGDQCAYRGEGGTMCAVGCLISDEQYDPILENKTIGDVGVKAAVEDSLGVDLSTEKGLLNLLRDAQETHDHVEPDEWLSDLKDLGDKYRLNTNVLNSYYRRENDV